MAMAEAEGQKRIKKADSSLAQALTKLLGLGLLSATALQHLAACAVQDGLEAENLMKLASLGAWGTYKANCHAEKYLQGYGLAVFNLAGSSPGFKVRPTTGDYIFPLATTSPDG